MDIRVAIYARYSTEMQSSASCDDQIRECTEYATRMGWSVVLVERDEAIRAGAMAGREGYARLLEAAKSGKFNVLLVFAVSRFSRDFLGGMTELANLTAMKVKIADTRLGIVDLDTGTGQIMISVHLMQAHQEVRTLGENSKRGLKGKVLKKFSSGGQPAYGHKRVPTFSETERDVDGRPKRIGVPHVPDPETAPIVRRMFTMYADGAAKSEISRTLNEEGIPTRDAGRTRKIGPRGERKANAGTWDDVGVASILKNPVYVGTRIWNQYSRTGKKLPSGKKALVKNPPEQWVTVENWCEPLIDRDLWDRVQARLAADKSEYEAKRTAKTNRQYLLSGFIQCAVCGRSFVIGSHFRGVRQYRCTTRTNRACANRVCVPQEALEAKVQNALDTLYKNPGELAKLVSKHNAAVREFNSVQHATVRRFESQLAKAEEAIAHIISAIEAGAGAALKSLVDTLAKREAEADELRVKVDEARSALQPFLLPRPQPLREYMLGDASIFTGDFAKDRTLVSGLLNSIQVHTDGTIVLHFRSEIFGAVRYEVRDLTADPMTLADRRKALHFRQSELTGVPKRVVDFGTGHVSVEADVTCIENTSGVPSGI